MPPIRGDARPMLTGRQLWRRARFGAVTSVLISSAAWMILPADAVPLPLRLALLVVTSAAIGALVGWWQYRAGDERDREDFVREWAWVRRLWRRARLRRP